MCALMAPPHVRVNGARRCSPYDSSLTTVRVEPQRCGQYYENSLPWDDKGARLLRVANYERYTELMDALRERVVRHPPERFRKHRDARGARVRHRRIGRRDAVAGAGRKIAEKPAGIGPMGARTGRAR